MASRYLSPTAFPSRARSSSPFGAPPRAGIFKTREPGRRRKTLPSADAPCGGGDGPGSRGHALGRAPWTRNRSPAAAPGGPAPRYGLARGGGPRRRPAARPAWPTLGPAGTAPSCGPSASPRDRRRRRGRRWLFRPVHPPARRALEPRAAEEAVPIKRCDAGAPRPQLRPRPRGGGDRGRLRPRGGRRDLGGPLFGRRRR